MTIGHLAVIGAGNMAEAIVRGALARGAIDADGIIAADVSFDRRSLFQDEFKIRCVEEAAVAAVSARAVLLSVKPQQMGAVLEQLQPSLPLDCTILSIAAGISTKFIESHLSTGHPVRVVRAMPNTPMMIGLGVVALTRGQHATDDDIAYARRLFEPAAVVMEVAEDKMDAVTAISGSGPAYFFYLTEQLILAGQSLGLTPEQSHLLATRTAEGAGKMLAMATDSPAGLRGKVTSPKGTTEAAIRFLDQHQAGQLMQQAVHAAARRSAELGS